MYIAANKETCDQIAQILEQQPDKPQNIRVFVAGMA